MNFVADVMDGNYDVINFILKLAILAGIVKIVTILIKRSLKIQKIS